MRIGIDGRELIRGQVTGIARFLRNFLEGVSILKSPHEIILFGNQRTDPTGVPDQATLRVIPERVTAWWDHISLSHAIERHGIDVFFSPFDKGPLRGGCPLVISVHDLFFLTLSEKSGIKRAVYDRYYFLLRRRIFNRASAIVTVSEVSKGDIVSLFNIPPDRIHVVPNAVTGSIQMVDDAIAIERVKAKYGVSGEYLMFVGNFKPHKNVKSLLDAFIHLPTQIQGKYTLLLCGYLDAFGEQTRRAADARNLQGLVHFTGAVTDEDLPALYSGASAFLFPSLYEGFGIPPLEAMACGTPVICSDAPPLPDVVGDAALVVNARHPEVIAKAVVRVLTDQAFSSELRDKGLKRAGLFSVERVTRMVLEVLEHVKVSR